MKKDGYFESVSLGTLTYQDFFSHPKFVEEFKEDIVKHVFKNDDPNEAEMSQPVDLSKIPKLLRLRIAPMCEVIAKDHVNSIAE